MFSKMKSALQCFGVGNSNSNSSNSNSNIVFSDNNNSSDEDDSENDNIDFDTCSSDPSTSDEPHIWSIDLDKHFVGEYSFAVIEANSSIEDFSQVEVGKDGTFVGVYDGHGGPECANFLSDRFFDLLMSRAKQSKTMSIEVIRNAVAATEHEFKEFVSSTRKYKPVIAAIGSCCLVGVIWRGTIYIANLGDSRAVIASLDSTNNIVAQQLTEEHNASRQEIRHELWSSHPEEPEILVNKEGVWRIKGLIQVSRSIGDLYLKDRNYAIPGEFTRFQFPGGPIKRAVLRADPTVCSRALSPNDKFMIFASDGLWEHLSNEEAVEIVHNNPRAGIAKRLIHKALRRAARLYKVRYATLKSTTKGQRRRYHDDITVVVIFIDQNMLNQEITPKIPAGLSVRGYINKTHPSRIELLSGLPKDPSGDKSGPSSSDNLNREPEGPNEDIVEHSSSNIRDQQLRGHVDDMPGPSNS